LCDNGITDEGASAIAATLPDSKLTSLDLSLNEITDEGINAIKAAALQQPTPPKVLF